MSDRTPAVACYDVTREYTRGTDSFFSRWQRSERPTVTAVKDVSLEIYHGEIVGVQGPSGSGKSTLLHLLASLDTPTSGTVEVRGTNTGTRSERGRARLRLDHVGLVFQRFYLLPTLSARSNVAIPLVQRGVGKRSRRARATSLLEQVGLDDRATHMPGELSGGEQQRVAIARALATDPDIIIADEPTGELDTESGEAIMDIFDDLARDGHAVVIGSHDPRTLERTTKRITLQDGRRINA